MLLKQYMSEKWSSLVEQQSRREKELSFHINTAAVSLLRKKKSHISKEITLAFPAIKTESYLKRLQFHIYGALPVKSPQLSTLTQQQRFILYWHTWLYNCSKDTSFIYTEWHLFYWNCEISPCCFTPSFIVGYLWSSAQGVATSCSLCAFQVLPDDKWLP